MLCLPFNVLAETCDIDKLTILSVSLKDKTGGVVELNNATVEDKTINLDLFMSDVGDYIQYELLVKNDSKEDYEFDKNSIKISSDYFDYSLESQDNSNIVKAGSTKKLLLKVNYSKEVPSDLFETGVYSYNNVMKLPLSNEKVSVTNVMNNPSTGFSLFIFITIILLIILGILFLLLKRKKISMFMILLSLFVIPIGTLALCKSEISINSNISIRKSEIFQLDFACSHNAASNHLKSLMPLQLKYYDGMTWNDYINSSEFGKLDEEVKDFILDSLDEMMSFTSVELIDCLDNASSYEERSNCFRNYPSIYNIQRNDKINSVDQGYYGGQAYCEPV